MLSHDEVQQLNRQRIQENNRQKAEEFKSKTEADAENGINLFIDRHSGFLAVSRDDVFVPNEANVKLLEDWIAEHGLLVTDANLETAFAACKSRLSPFRPDQYTRKTDLSVSRIAPQARTFAKEPTRAPFTRQQVVDFSTSRMRLEIRRYGIAEINRILEQK